jgi:hypothetical protein
MKSQTTATLPFRVLISALVVLLVFEGLLRKMLPGGLRVAVFFAKDFVVLIMGMLVVRLPKPEPIRALWRAYLGLLLLFIPVVLATATHDPILAVFGAERYLLMPMVAFCVYAGFEHVGMDGIRSYAGKLALLLIPTTLVAMVQLKLPADHWLNSSVAGESMEGFAAGGKLRICSTFAFVSQFGMFLSAELFVCAIVFSGFRRMAALQKIMYGSLPFALLVSSYATGSRGTVLGGAVIIGIAAVFGFKKGLHRQLMKFLLLAAFLFLSFLILQVAFPDAFVAYGEREEGKYLGLSADNKERTFGMFTDLFMDGDRLSLFGSGLGTMSNGADQLSSYAYSIRKNGFWTESDLATTLYEGGIYLLIVWTAFRFWVIFHTAGRVLRVADDYTIPSSFCEGYIVLIGVIGTLGIQPPLAIWWWMAVGLVTLFWQKSTEVKFVSGAPPAELLGMAPAPSRKVRGRSVFAEHLHNSPPK